MKDNRTSQPAEKYDAEIHKTHPMYDLFHEETLNLIEVVNQNPGSWLDTGCGTGTLIYKAAKVFKNTLFTLADPSEAMLVVAKNKLDNTDIKANYIQAGSEEINYPEESFNVITAILSHHYFGQEERKKATLNCYKMLKTGGVYITFENIRPFTEQGIDIGLNLWEKEQIKAGKTKEAAQNYKKRFGNEYHPITIDSYLELLRQVGFSVVEILMVSGLRAGFYAIK